MEHTVQMDKLATFKYLYRVGLPSIYNAVENSYENNRYGKLVFSVDHEEFRTETDANRNSKLIYPNFTSVNRKRLVSPSNPTIGSISDFALFERIVGHVHYALHPEKVSQTSTATNVH